MQRRPLVRLTATLALAAVMAVITAARAGPHSQAAPVQLVANPYFAEWASGLPASWSLSGSATAAEVLDSYDAVRAGPNRAAIVTAALDGYVKVKYQAEQLDEEPARSILARFDAVGLPAYVILHPKIKF